MTTIWEDAEDLAKKTIESMSLKELQSLVKHLGWDKESEHNALPDWYGIKGIKFIWHNEWADPEIEYRGRRCSCYVVEDTMWERFEEDELSDPEEFGRYMKENEDEVKELCELALFPEEWEN